MSDILLFVIWCGGGKGGGGSWGGEVVGRRVDALSSGLLRTGMTANHVHGSADELFWRGAFAVTHHRATATPSTSTPPLPHPFPPPPPDPLYTPPSAPTSRLNPTRRYNGRRRPPRNSPRLSLPPPRRKARLPRYFPHPSLSPPISLHPFPQHPLTPN